MKKIALLLSVILSLLSSGTLLAAGGKNDAGTGTMGIPPEQSVKKGSWSITAPATSLPGDCITVVFAATRALTETKVNLRNSGGSVVAKSSAFKAQEPIANNFTDTAPLPILNEAAFTRVAIIGLSTTLKPGTYLIEAAAVMEGELINSVTTLIVEKRVFSSEEISLDPKNSAIKSDFSKERISQIEKLNEILFSQNQDAARFFGPFREPLESVRRTSGFGDRRVYLYASGKQETSIHYGIDYGVPKGTPVFASGDGKIVFAALRISTGWTVVIEHLPGLYSLYYHLDALLSNEGEMVRTGTLIARSGSTGLSTGPHLHWEFRINGEAISPDYLVGRKIY